MKRFKVSRIKITKDNIGLFESKDGRVGSKRFNKERDWLENEIVDFVENGNKDYPERYDLTVLTFDHNKELWFLTDGSHRIQALKRLFERGDIDRFDVIMIPDALVLFGIQSSEREKDLKLYEQNKLLNKMLREERLPTWIKKYDVEQDGNNWTIWVNVKAINSGGKDMTMLSVSEYNKTREQQPKL